MRQKNSDGAEVVWTDPEEGHTPPSGVHCSVCSCSPGKLHLLVEIYGQAVAGLHLHALTLHSHLHNANHVICFGSYSKVPRVISTARTGGSCFFILRIFGQKKKQTFGVGSRLKETWPSMTSVFCMNGMLHILWAVRQGLCLFAIDNSATFLHLCLCILRWKQSERLYKASTVLHTIS